MKPNPLKSGKRIKQLRLASGLTMEELGRKLENSPRATVSNWERGTNLPNPQKLKLLAEIGNTTIDWIKWGSTEEYIQEFLIDLGYQQLILDYPEIPHEIFGEINENYSKSFTINDEYELLNQIILITFRQKYSPLFNIYLKELMASEIEPKIGMYANKEHSISKERFISRFHSNFNDLLRRKEFKYGETKQIVDSAIELLREMDEAYKLKQKYLSIEDFFSQNTQTQFQTEKFLSDLSEKYNFPYKANSTTSKFLTKNHNKFNK